MGDSRIPKFSNGTVCISYTKVIGETLGEGGLHFPTLVNNRIFTLDQPLP